MEKRHPVTIMQQIEDLKNWHKQQEELFKKDMFQSHKHTNKPNSKNPMSECIKNSDSIQILNEVESAKSNDEIPINPCHSDFNQMLKNDEKTVYGNNCLKPKRKFLKKGEGLARFRMVPTKPQIRKSKSFHIKQSDNKLGSSNNEGVLEAVEGDESEGNLIKSNDHFTSSKSSGELVTLSWKDYLCSMLTPNNDYFHSENSILTDSSNHSLPDSFLEKITAIGKRRAREREEIKVFEILEQHALDSSFCSSSSMVARLMENSVKSTPLKEKHPHINEQKSSSYNQREHDYFENKKLCTNDIDKNQTDKEQIKDHLDQSQHVRFCEENSYRSFIDYSDSAEKENQIIEDNYFGDDKQWSDCDCSTQYSSSDEDARPISPPSTDERNVVTVEIKANNDKGNFILHSVDQVGKPLEDGKDSITTLKFLKDNNRCDEDEKNGNENNNLASNCSKQLQQTSELQSQNSLVHLRLKELEDEIEIFRKENAKLKKLQSDFEQEYKLFQNDRKTFNLQIEEERRKNYELLEDEKQKLAKEKLVFEKYTKNLRKNPSKEERKEIQTLKEELAAIKEELLKKESRWGAAQARVRNQVKLLEEDNRKLKQEIEELRKQSKKVNVLKNERVSNTHLLHTISQQLTKISPRNIEETLASSNTAKKQAKLVKENQPNKILSENVDNIEHLSSGSNECILSSNTNSIERNIKKIVDEAFFEPVMNAYIIKDKIPEQSPTDSEDKNLEEVKVIETSPKLSDNIVQEYSNKYGHREIHFADGRKEIRYKNGNVKKINPLGDIIKIVYFNGDVKEICKDGTVKYYYNENRIWHTTYPDGLELLDFPDGQVERRHLNGTIEVLYPNKCRKLSYTDGSEEWVYTDGTMLKIDSDKQKILSLPNGQREIHTKEHKRREYPDGTVKFIYPDGTQETRYSNGRIRLKDKDGKLIMDSG